MWWVVSGMLRRFFLKRLAALAEHPLVGEAKGVGLIAGIELVADKASKKNFDPAKGVAQKLSSLAEAEGLIVRPLPSDRIALCPPLIISEAEIGELFRPAGTGAGQDAGLDQS